jgi:Ala-tRNA(Pro) deacylase
MATTQELMKYLTDNDIEFSVLKHSPVKSAFDISLAAHLPVRYIVQIVPIQIDGHSWMIILPADRKINFNAICRILHAKDIRDGHEKDWSIFFPNCELSTLPPFGNLYGFQVLADISLQEGKRIIFSACSNTQSIFMRWDDYTRLVQPLVAEISKALPMSDSEKAEQCDSILPVSSDHLIFSEKQHELDNYFQNKQN